MFTLNSLKKIKLEFQNSLTQEFSKLKNISEKQRKIFLKYKEDESLGGMENWLVSFSEKEFFLDCLEELGTRKSLGENFLDEIIFLLKETYGDEEFRFGFLEDIPKDRSIIESTLKEFYLSSEKNLIQLNSDYLKGNFQSYKHYLKSPSESGLDLKFSLKKTPKKKIQELELAMENLEILWKEGFELFKLFTSKINLVRSQNLVSYSHFTEFGISYLNALDRNFLDLIDDLIHENSHHHLNLLIKKYPIFKKMDRDEKFYSPWRESYRSIYAIFHAVFTFTYGSILFFQIFNSPNFKYSRLTTIDLKRSGFRFLEESIMNEFSLIDLKENSNKFTKEGNEIIDYLDSWNKNSKVYVNEIYKSITNNDKKKIKNLKKRLNKFRS
ncbi:MAG: HEXXH motif-containing putative peptide modification protein [Leptospiraceae bacterium]|nr:HEXXH motif-containing putative peptide modification protein [Leptospiraceae bacterium]